MNADRFLEQAPSATPVSPILVTGFEAFGGEQVNPTAFVVRALDGLEVHGRRVRTCILPCAFGASAKALRHALDAWEPEVAIALGQAGGRPEISLERVALNIDDARIPDNLGAQPIDVPVVPEAPNAYFSTLPIKAMVHALREQGIPASVSQSAGTFVCNHLFFHLLHEQRQRPGLRRAGFVHIPFLPEQACAHPGAPSMSLEWMVRALETVLTLACQAEPDLRIPGGADH